MHVTRAYVYLCLHTVSLLLPIHQCVELSWSMGKLKYCDCRTVWYCDAWCQSRHWPAHKAACKKAREHEHNKDT